MTSNIQRSKSPTVAQKQAPCPPPLETLPRRSSPIATVTQLPVRFRGKWSEDKTPVPSLERQVAGVARAS